MRTVYFFTSPTCGACEGWKPIIEDFVARNLTKCIVLRCNPNLRHYAFGDWEVRYTPSVAVQEGRNLLRYAEGQPMPLADLERFVFDDKEPAPPAEDT